MPALIKKHLIIAAPIQKVWAALTDAKSIGAWMGDDAVKSTLRKGGGYALFGGETTGKFTVIKNRPGSNTRGGSTSGKRSGQIQSCAGS